MRSCAFKSIGEEGEREMSVEGIAASHDGVQREALESRGTGS
jgi:hypothetical protein